MKPGESGEDTINEISGNPLIVIPGPGGGGGLQWAGYSQEAGGGGEPSLEESGRDSQSMSTLILGAPQSWDCGSGTVVVSFFIVHSH